MNKNQFSPSKNATFQALLEYKNIYLGTLLKVVPDSCLPKIALVNKVAFSNGGSWILLTSIKVPRWGKIQNKQKSRHRGYPL